ncbi:MAG: hypothetical protein Kow0092_11830 [Deferrisomatales bacterium]
MLEASRLPFDVIGSLAALGMSLGLLRQARRLPEGLEGLYFRWLAGFLCVFAISRVFGHAVLPLAVRAGFPGAQGALPVTGALNTVVFAALAAATWVHRHMERAEAYLEAEKERLRADLGRSQQALEAQRERLEWALRTTREILAGVVERGEYDRRFPSPGGPRCWEHFDCAETSCPAYHVTSDRCWRLRGGIQGRRPCRQRPSCRECPVRVLSTQDPIQDLGEMVNDLLHVLEAHAREEALYLSALSHDIRSPLSSLKGFLDLLKETPPGLSPRQEEMVEMAGFAVRRVLHLAENLVLEGRAQAGALVPHPRAFDLGAALETLRREVEPQARLRQVRVRWAEASRDAVQVEADPVMVARAAANLLDNALKHAPRGSTVHLRLERRGTAVRIGVEDEGPGVPEEQRQIIFEPYRRFSDRGTGLGLYVVSSVCLAHGGRAWVEGHDGGGSVFWMELPAAEVH